MEYFYNQNKNYGYYDQPVHATGHSMATAAMVLGIAAVGTFWTLSLPIVLGSLAVVLALLSRGFDKKLMSTAKVAVSLGVSGLVISIALVTSAVVTVLVNPDILLDFGRQTDQNVEQMYGRSTEDLIGNSYEDIMEQYVNLLKGN